MVAASGGTPRRRPTLQDVADRAGVSRALVSIVVRGAPGASPATRERVQAAVEALGYRPDVHARLLAQGRARLLGVTIRLGDPFHAAVAERLYRAVERHGYQLLLSATSPDRDELRAVDTLLGYRSEALVLVGPAAPEPALAGLARRVPVVVVARRVADGAVDAVRTADDLGVVEALDHLVRLGHRRVDHVDGARAPGAADRRRGYRTAARRAGVSGQVRRGGPAEGDGARAARELLAGADLPTAVICYNDRVALGLVDVLLRAGVQVPRDVSVVGFDDTPMAGLAHIALTSVAQDVDRMAELAVHRLVSRLEPAAAGPAGAEPAGPDGGHDVVLPPRLVVRGSTAPPRTGGQPASMLSEKL